MRRKLRKPYRIKKREPILKSRFFGLGILFSIILIGFFYLICFSSIFQIKKIKISGNQKVSTENIQKIVQSQIEKKILFFPTKSIFLADLNKTNEILLKRFPLISKVNLKREFFNTLTVNIKERKPVAVFCQFKDCFLIDKKGIIFEKSLVKNSKKIIIRSPSKNYKLELGKGLIEEEKLAQILKISSRLKKDLEIQTNEIKMISSERINIKTSEDWEVYFNPKGDINWQLTKLKVVLKEEIPPQKRKNLDYIDLRFGNLAPYKYR